MQSEQHRNGRVQPPAASRLERRLREGHLVVTAEINPPRHADGEAVRSEARLLRDVVDAVNLTDCTRGIVRMSSAAAALLARAEGVEPIVQMTCRDRNRIALQSELLGLSALGLHNVLLLTGDDPSQGDHPDAKPVFDLNSATLLAVANRMRSQGTLMSGRNIKHPPHLFIGAAADPERDLAQPGRMTLAEKVTAGADFVQTQAVFDIERFERWMRLVRAAGLHREVAILAGIFLLDSAQRADFLRTKVPGIVMPECTYRRLAEARDERAEGTRLAVELVERLLGVDGVRGVHLMGIGSVGDLRTVAEGAGLRRRGAGASETV